jgi:hypothetical protein
MVSDGWDLSRSASVLMAIDLTIVQDEPTEEPGDDLNGRLSPSID